MGLTLAQKIRNSHTVVGGAEEDLLYVDLQMLYEVGTSQAFDRLRAAGRSVRRPDLNLATEDHHTPTRNIYDPIKDPDGRRQSELLRENCAEFGIPLHRRGEAGQGIVHVIAPERGLARPGMIIVCCDSHTTTLGAFGALAFGIGASQVGHVLATQTLPVRRLGQMAINVSGQLGAGVTAKDLALAMISAVGSAGAQGHIIEYRGEAIGRLSMEARMTLCNMSVEMGSRAGLIAPDSTTVEYLLSHARLPSEVSAEEAVEHWLTWKSDDGAEFDRIVDFDAGSVVPHVSWGTTPEQSAPVDGVVPDPEWFDDARQRDSARRALSYMDLQPGTPFRDIVVDTVFVGSCTNGRIEDLRAVAAVLDRRRVAEKVEMIIVPGSAAVRRQAVTEGLDRVFAAAGADFRAGAGCSLCVALSEDRLKPGQRSASTSNRNFEGRQGTGARTHLVSPAVAAATAVAGRICSPDLL